MGRSVLLLLLLVLCGASGSIFFARLPPERVAAGEPFQLAVGSSVGDTGVVTLAATGLAGSLVGELSGTQLVFDGLQLNVLGTVTIQARLAGGTDGDGEVVASWPVLVAERDDEAIENLRVARMTVSSLVLAWTPPVDASGDVTVRATAESSGGSHNVISSVGAGQITLTVLTLGERYSFALRDVATGDVLVSLDDVLYLAVQSSEPEAIFLADSQSLLLSVAGPTTALLADARLTVVDGTFQSTLAVASVAEVDDDDGDDGGDDDDDDDVPHTVLTFDLGQALAITAGAPTPPAAVTVLLNGVATDVGVELLTPPSASSFSPRVGPSDGQIVVTVLGQDFVVDDDDVSCSFDGTRTSATVVSATQLECLVPAPPENTVDLQVVFNGLSVPVLAASTFTYRATPQVYATRPSAVPRLAGTLVTVSGTNFASDVDVVECTFRIGTASLTAGGSMDADGRVVICFTPAELAATGAATQSFQLSVSLDGIESNVLSVPTFTSPTTLEVSPDRGTMLGGTSVTVRARPAIGVNVTGALSPKCRFDTSDVVGVVAREPTTGFPLVTCLSPPHASGLVDLRVSLNDGVDFASPRATFVYTDPDATTLAGVSPPFGPVSQDTTLTISGSNFPASSPSARCHFGAATSTATVVDGETLTCVLDAATAAAAAADARVRGSDTARATAAAPLTRIDVDVSFDGGDVLYTTTFLLYATPVFLGFSPTSARRADGISVVVQSSAAGLPDGRAVTPSQAPTCHFGDIAVEGVFEFWDQFSCAVPAAGAGRVPFRVSLNGVDRYAPTPGTFTFTGCPVGEYAPTGADACEPCPAGTHLGASGVCEPCPADTFSAVAGATACTECPTGTRTAPGVSNATSLLACTCRDGTYSPSLQAGTACLDCPEGAQCVDYTIGPRALPGYWAAADEVFYECTPPDACLGETCAVGYTGDVCGRCDDNYYRAGGLCRECDNNAWLFAVLFAAFLLITAIVLIVKASGSSSAFLAALGILASFFQVLAVAADLDIVWPESVERTFYVVGVPFNIQLDFVQSECSLEWSFRGKFYATLAVPLVMALVFVLINLVMYARRAIARVVGPSIRERFPAACVAPRPGKDRTFFARVRHSLVMVVASDGGARAAVRLRNHSINGFLMFMTLAYLLLLAKAIQIWDCRTQSDGRRTLDASPAIECFGDVWYSMLPGSLAAIIVYGAGLPFFYRLIFQAADNQHSRQFIERYSSLFDRYTADASNFESFVLLRKAAIAIVPAAFASTPILQPILLLLVLFAALQLQSSHRPFANERFNRLETILLWCSALVLFAGVAFQAADFSSGGESDDARVALTVVTLAVFAIACVVILVAVAAELTMDLKTFRDSRHLDPVLDRVLRPSAVSYVRAWLETDDGKLHSDDVIRLATRVAQRHDAHFQVDSASTHRLATTIILRYGGQLFEMAMVPYLVSIVVEDGNDPKRTLVLLRRMQWAAVEREIRGADRTMRWSCQPKSQRVRAAWSVDEKDIEILHAAVGDILQPETIEDVLAMARVDAKTATARMLPGILRGESGGSERLTAGGSPKLPPLVQP